MKFIRRAPSCLLLCLSLLAAPVARPHPPGDASSKPGVSIADAIEMTRIQSFAFSNDGMKYAALVWRGDLKSLCNVYSLLIFDTNDRKRAPRRPVTALNICEPRAVIYAPIEQLKFTDGDRAVAFLAHLDGKTRQVYATDLTTGKLRQLTNHPTDVRSYEISGDGKTLMYSALGRDEVKAEEERLRMGYSILDRGVDPPSVAVKIYAGFVVPRIYDYFALHVGRRNPQFLGDTSAIRAGPQTDLAPDLSAIGDASFPRRVFANAAHYAVAPGGQYAVFWPYIQAGRATRLSSYAFYSRPAASDSSATNLAARFSPGLLRIAASYGLVNLSTGESEALIDAPHDALGNNPRSAVWLPDGRSVIIHSLLPLDAADQTENARRAQGQPQLVEIDIAIRRVTPLNIDASWQAIGWNDKTHSLLLKRGATLASVSKQGSVWSAVKELGAVKGFNDRYDSVTNGAVVVGVEDALDVAPEIAVHDLAAKTSAVLTDLNPQLRERAFGAVEKIFWESRYDKQSFGYLIKPNYYTPGKRYPLVILLKDEPANPADNSFIIDGRRQLISFAIQTLAAKGFVVLFTPLPAAFLPVLGKPEETLYVQAHVESGIAELDRRGLIDKTRMAISGWSRAGYHTNMLLMSGIPFAAGVILDGGGHEYNDGFRNFTREELSRIKTPLLLESCGFGAITASAMIEQLQLLKRPVEFYHYPGAPHNLLFPGNRWTSLNNSVDWYRFWLQNYEDPDPKKKSQYERWRKLR